MMVIFMMSFHFLFEAKKIKFLSCIFPKKYTFLLMYIRSRSRPFFSNVASDPAPLKKGAAPTGSGLPALQNIDIERCYGFWAMGIQSE